MTDKLKKEKWDESYLRKGGHVFFPHEEIIRFFAKYIRKRTGVNEFENRIDFSTAPKVLDVGCGMGRHMVFASQMGLDAYGVDLSSEAIRLAKNWFEEEGLGIPDGQAHNGSITELPWEDAFFDFAMSHGVLDSMYFDIARQGLAEVGRTLKPGGLFYCDLISGDDFKHAKEYSGDEVVETKHENGTVQSYYNYGRIQELCQGLFDIKEAFLIRKEEVHSGVYISRWHLVLEKQ